MGWNMRVCRESWAAGFYPCRGFPAGHKIVYRMPGMFLDLSLNQEIPMNDSKQAERGWGRFIGKYYLQSRRG